ncbi:MAG: hypothetical protein H7A25_15680 [Leptospiraceae bacterium]|nr:hypothetical protein [Leptospiraceae bacterium]MCP5501341.1 hypothetical protein [Leptospiraceae bacterium]
MNVRFGSLDILVAIFSNPHNFTMNRYNIDVNEIRPKGTLVSLLAALNLAVSGIYLNPPYAPSSYELLFVAMLSNFLFLEIFSFLMGVLIDYKTRREDSISLVQYNIILTKYGLSVFALSAPLSVILLSMNITGPLNYVMVVLALILLYLWFLSRAIASLYDTDERRALKVAFSTFSYFVFIPLSFYLYLFTTIIEIKGVQF